MCNKPNAGPWQVSLLVACIFFFVPLAVFCLDLFIQTHLTVTECKVVKHDVEVRVCDAYYPWTGYVTYCFDANDVVLCQRTKRACNSTRVLVQSALESHDALGSSRPCWYWTSGPTQYPLWWKSFGENFVAEIVVLSVTGAAFLVCATGTVVSTCVTRDKPRPIEFEMV